MEFNDLTDEQKSKVNACKTPEELIELAKTEGYELTDEQLESVSGGAWDDGGSCTQVNCKTFCGVVGR